MTAEPMCPDAPVMKTSMRTPCSGGEQTIGDLMTLGVIRTIPGMSPCVITVSYDRAMPRWEAGAEGRLAQAAYELYFERGFET